MSCGKAGGLIASWIQEASEPFVPYLPNHDELIGSLNPCQAGGLIKRLAGYLFLHFIAGGADMSETIDSDLPVILFIEVFYE